MAHAAHTGGADRAGAFTVRRASSADAEQIARIYNEAIAAGTSTFQAQPRSPADIVEWFKRPALPILVAAEPTGEVVGWARVAPYSAWPYYSGVGEASVYVAERRRGRGVGTALAATLAAEAERAGLYKLVGKLFPENDASGRLVARLGFRAVGLHLRHGRLDGKWRDVLLVELLLGEAQPDSMGKVERSPRPRR